MFSKSELNVIKDYLEGTKDKLKGDPKRYNASDLSRTKAYVESLKLDLEKQLKSLAVKEAVVYTATGLTILTTIITWLMGQPWYVQLGVGIVTVLVIAGLVYYIYQAKDRRQAILELIQLIKDIIAIIQGLQPTPTPTPTPEPEPEPEPEPDPASEHAPGVVFVDCGTLKVAQVGGEHQKDMPEALKGDKTWPGLTVRVMDSQSPDFDVLSNFLWAYWYDGNLAPKGWIISQQGYYYENNTACPPKNHIRSIKDKPWIQPGQPVGVPMNEVRKIERVNNEYVLTVLHDGQEQRIVWGKRQ
jgi:hypothetical protein